MRKLLLSLLVVVMLVQIAGCGGGDALAGTWTGKSEMGDITWVFDGKGKCSMESPFGKQEGEYSIDNDKLTVKLEAWDKKQVHTFTVKDGLLTFEPTDENPYAPGYKDLKKK